MVGLRGDEFGLIIVGEGSEVFLGSPVVADVIEQVDEAGLVLPVDLLQFEVCRRGLPDHLGIKKEWAGIMVLQQVPFLRPTTTGGN